MNWRRELGIHRLIKEQEPLVLYSFDTNDLYNSGSYNVYTSTIESDYPTLEVVKYQIENPINSTTFARQSLSYTETSSVFKSFYNSTGSISSEKLASNLKDKTTYSRFKINDISYTAECNLEDNGIIPLSSYTLLMHINVLSKGNYSNNIPQKLISDGFYCKSLFGYFSKANIDKITQIPVIGDNIGIEYFGYSSRCYLETQFDREEPYIDMFTPTEYYNVNPLYEKDSKLPYFEYSNILFTIYNNSIYIIDGNELILLFTIDIGYNHLLKLNVLDNIINASLDGKIKKTITLKTQNVSKKLQIGPKCYLKNTNQKINDAFINDIYFPYYTVAFDNVCILDHDISDNDMLKMYDFNRTMEMQYLSLGMDTIIDLGAFYKNNLSILGISNTLSNEFILSNYLDNCIINKYADTMYEYSLFIGENSLLTLNSYITSINFSFKTDDQYGSLFYINNKYYIKVDNGILKLYNRGILLFSYTGISNSKWHNFLINDGKIYLNYNLIYSNTDLSKFYGVFGNISPACGNSLNFEISNIIYSKYSSFIIDINRLKQIQTTNRLLYKSNGTVTINNLPINSKICIYNRDNGTLIKIIESDNIQGSFEYSNTNPYPLTILVIDKLNRYQTYILDPVQIT